MGRSRYKVRNTKRPHFFTCTIVQWIPLFADSQLLQIIVDSFSFLQKENRLQLYAYVIMKDHIHFIASSHNLSKEVGDFKSFTARRIIDLLKSKKSFPLLRVLEASKLRYKKDRLYQVWQEGSHPQEIINERMMTQKIDYIHNNPVRRGYVRRSTDWIYSSARSYHGLAGPLKVITDW